MSKNVVPLVYYKTTRIPKLVEKWFINFRPVFGPLSNAEHLMLIVILNLISDLVLKCFNILQRITEP